MNKTNSLNVLKDSYNTVKNSESSDSQLVHSYMQTINPELEITDSIKSKQLKKFYSENVISLRDRVLNGETLSEKERNKIINKTKNIYERKLSKLAGFDIPEDRKDTKIGKSLLKPLEKPEEDITSIEYLKSRINECKDNEEMKKAFKEILNQNKDYDPTFKEGYKLMGIQKEDYPFANYLFENINKVAENADLSDVYAFLSTSTEKLIDLSSQPAHLSGELVKSVMTKTINSVDPYDKDKLIDGLIENSKDIGVRPLVIERVMQNGPKNVLKDEYIKSGYIPYLEISTLKKVEKALDSIFTETDKNMKDEIKGIIGNKNTFQSVSRKFQSFIESQNLYKSFDKSTKVDDFLNGYFESDNSFIREFIERYPSNKKRNNTIIQNALDEVSAKYLIYEMRNYAKLQRKEGHTLDFQAEKDLLGSLKKLKPQQLKQKLNLRLGR